LFAQPWLTTTLLLLAAVPPAAESGVEAPPSIEQGISMKTLGGRQFWGDVLFFYDWRIQQHVLTRHFRLLDGNDYRHASGTFEECQATLTEIKQSRGLPPMSGKAVVLVHGIGRSSKSFRAMRSRLSEAGYQVFGFDYPSTRVSIDEAAQYLQSAIASLEGLAEINFVAHSMGGLVVRAYLARERDERIGRLVMIGVPNLGADLADRLRNVMLYKAVLGPAGQELVTDELGLIPTLPVPDFEFAVIAGGRGTLQGYNPLIPGDDDGTVSVSCTRLPGAADFAVVNGLHTFLMNHPETVDQAVRFLSTGRLRAAGEARPIPPLTKPARDPS
jgi:pimeloyl-ACP methyl ester carboxylesterase